MEPYVEEPKEEQDEEEDIFCDICEVQMQSASSLIKHKKQKHEPKISPDCGVIVKGEMSIMFKGYCKIKHEQSYKKL